MGMSAAELKLFGAFELKDASGRQVDLPGQKDRALLAYLAIHGTAHAWIGIVLGVLNILVSVGLILLLVIAALTK